MGAPPRTGASVPLDDSALAGDSYRFAGLKRAEGGGWDRARASEPDRFATFEQLDFLRHRLSTVEEIADAVVFLASPRAAGINAADVHVDGGQRRPSMR